MSSIRIRKPKRPRKIQTSVMHSHHAKIASITRMREKYLEPAPGIRIVAFDGVDGNIALAYHGPDNWLYFLCNADDGNFFLCNLDGEVSDSIHVLSYSEDQIDEVAHEIVEMFNLKVDAA